ncbi:IS200/IS605 family transposase [Arsenophonus sp.]|uniref:IS200/IS605 family transposase n=1 Tax=Arsenophonus sp. TaxID=1872640 RepID=UPI003879291D
MVNIVTKRNCVYQTAYHVIWCPKYRRDILVGKVAETVGMMLDNLCSEKGWDMISKEIQPDHIHLFVSIPPAVAVANAVKVLKGVTARQLFQQFPLLKKKLWGGNLWSPSYYVGTAGNVSAQTIQCYIERSEHVNKRR